MKPLVRWFLLLALSLCICLPSAVAGKRKFEAVKIYPKSGHPMVVKNFSLPWYREVKGKWNNQRIEIKISRIKAIKLLAVHPDDNDAELEVELTFQNGEKHHVRLQEGYINCSGETQFGKLTIPITDIEYLDLFPDLSKAQAEPPKAPARKPPQGIVLTPTD